MAKSTGRTELETAAFAYLDEIEYHAKRKDAYGVLRVSKQLQAIHSIRSRVHSLARNVMKEEVNVYQIVQDLEEQIKIMKGGKSLPLNLSTVRAHSGIEPSEPIKVEDL